MPKCQYLTSTPPQHPTNSQAARSTTDQNISVPNCQCRSALRLALRTRVLMLKCLPVQNSNAKAAPGAKPVSIEKMIREIKAVFFTSAEVPSAVLMPFAPVLPSPEASARTKGPGLRCRRIVPKSPQYQIAGAQNARGKACQYQDANGEAPQSCPAPVLNFQCQCFQRAPLLGGGKKKSTSTKLSAPDGQR